MPHRVRIIKRQNRYTVHPANLQVQKGEQVNFRVFQSNATVLVPNDLLVDAAGAVVSAIPLTAGVKSADYTVNSRVPDGAYPYAIYCKDSNDFAEGNSPPTMIIE
jgi:hypothetical protein